MSKPRRTTLLRALRQSNSRSQTDDEAGRDMRTAIAVVMVMVGLVLGGGGTSNPHTELVLQGFAAALIAAWIVAPGRAPRRVARPLVVIAVLAIALPLIQLIPLPPSVWHALPGRELEVASLALVGKDMAWMPLSITPPQTFAVVLAMVPPIAMMWFVASLDDEGRASVLGGIVVVTLASALLGVLQLASPFGHTPSFYSYIHRGWVIGFQASRNAEVDVLLIGLLAATALYALGAKRSTATSAGSYTTGLPIYATVAAILLSAAVLTGSRGGIVLIPAVILFALLMLRNGSLFARRTLIAVMITVFVGVSAAWLLRDNAVLDKVGARFAVDGDFRTELWTDTLFAIHQYWPVGGGMGGFVQLMTPVERLEVVDPTLPSRAHNDYLELVLESGAIGPVILAIIAAILLFLAFKAWRNGGIHRLQTHFAVAAFFVIAAHSLVDYPLRSMALAMLVATAAGLLSRERDPAAGHGTRKTGTAEDSEL